MLSRKYKQRAFLRPVFICRSPSNDPPNMTTKRRKRRRIITHELRYMLLTYLINISLTTNSIYPTYKIYILRLSFQTQSSYQFQFIFEYRDIVYTSFQYHHVYLFSILGPVTFLPPFLVFRTFSVTNIFLCTACIPYFEENPLSLSPLFYEC